MKYHSNSVRGFQVVKFWVIACSMLLYLDFIYYTSFLCFSSIENPNYSYVLICFCATYLLLQFESWLDFITIALHDPVLTLGTLYNSWLLIIKWWGHSCEIRLYVILKALPKVCTENAAQGACQEMKTAWGKAQCCIYLETPPECYIIHTDKLRQCFQCCIVFSCRIQSSRTNFWW